MKKALAALLLTLCLACALPAQTVVTTSVNVTPSTVTVKQGQTQQFTVTTVPAGLPVVWLSSSGQITPSGLFTAPATSGQVVVTAMVDNPVSFSSAVIVPTEATSTENGYCAKGDVWIGATTDGPAALPKKCVYTGLDGSPSFGATTQVPSGANVATFLAAASCGDTIMLAAGGTYAPFVLPAKNCDAGHWINVRSSASDTLLPAEGQRLNPSYCGTTSLANRPAFSGGTGNACAKVQGTAALAVSAASGANFYRIGPGVEVTRPQDTSYNSGLVTLMGGDHIIWDRDWVHGSELKAESKNGFGLSGSTNIAIINSYLNSFVCLPNGVCTDSHAITGGDGLVPAEGTWKIFNNFIEASTENILFGGASAGNQTPFDIEIRQNRLFKNPAWNPRSPIYGGWSPVVKNLFECKNCGRVLFEGNRLEYSWGGFSQTGNSILLTSRGQWSQVSDITVRFVHISHTGDGFQIVATRTSTTPPLDGIFEGRISFHDILSDDVQPVLYNGNANLAQVSSGYQVNAPIRDVVLNHITYVTTGASGQIFMLGNSVSNPVKQMGSFTFTNSIVVTGRYPVWGLGGTFVCAANGQPAKSFTQCFTTPIVTGNLIIGWAASPYAKNPWPAGNQYPADAALVFADPTSDYHVLAPWQNAGTDGKDIGPDIDMLSAFMATIE